MRAEFSACPPPYKVDRIGEHSVKVSFAENAEEIKSEGGSRWFADVYDLITAYTPNIEERIESNYDAWMSHAKDVDTEKNATETTTGVNTPTVEGRIEALENAMLEMIIGVTL